MVPELQDLMREALYPENPVPQGHGKTVGKRTGNKVCQGACDWPGLIVGAPAAGKGSWDPRLGNAVAQNTCLVPSGLAWFHFGK